MSERNRLRAAGFSDAEIDAELGPEGAPGARGVRPAGSSLSLLPGGRGSRPPSIDDDIDELLGQQAGRAHGGTDPVKARKADRWDAVVAGGMDADAATATVEHELSSGAPRGLPGFASESTGTRATTKNASREQVAANRAQNVADAVSTARALLNGATFRFGDELEAGVRSALGPRKYRDVRDEIRADNDAFALTNPGLALTGELLGGALTGGALLKAAQRTGTAAAALRATQLAPKVAASSSVAGRVGAAAKAGAAGGALLGAGNAREVSDLPGEVGTGLVVGGVGGAAVGSLSEAVNAARNLLAAGVKGRGASGVRNTLGRVIEANSPEVMGARRVLRTMGRAGQSVDDLAAADAVAPAEASFASLIDNDQGTRALRIARNAGRERDVIDRGLAERSAETPAMWSRTVSRETGVAAPRDARAVADEALAAAERPARKLYGRANAQPDVADERIAQAVEKLEAMPEYGPAALRRARTLAAAKGDAFPETFRPEVPEGTTRTARGRLKDFAKASDAALLDEYEAITTRMQRDIGQAQYNVVEADVSGTQYGQKILTANTRGGGPSLQAKAQRRLVQSQGVLDRIEAELNTRGVDVSDALARRAMAQEAGATSQSGQLADLFGEEALTAPASVNPVRVVDMHRLRKGIDEVMRGMRTEIESGKGSPELYGAMQEIRGQVDAAYKAAGGKAARRADRLVARAKARGESFAAGQRVEQAGTVEGVQRMAGAVRDPDAFREGAASRLLERAAGTADGEAGQVRNVVQGPLGSETRRARTRAAFPDDASFERARADAEQIVKYLREQRAVSGNSTTAANLAELADEFGIDPSTILQHATSPTKLALALFKDRARSLAQGMSAEQATEMGRLLAAGLPGQQPRKAAVQTVRDLLPSITTLMQRQALLRGAVGARGGEAVRR